AQAFARLRKKAITDKKRSCSLCLCRTTKPNRRKCSMCGLKRLKKPRLHNKEWRAQVKTLGTTLGGIVNALHSESMPRAVSHYTTPPFTPNTTYSWRVRACNANGCSYSGWRAFHRNAPPQ